MNSDRLPGGAGSNPRCLWGLEKDGIHSEQVRHRAYPEKIKHFDRQQIESIGEAR